MGLGGATISMNDRFIFCVPFRNLRWLFTAGGSDGATNAGYFEGRYITLYHESYILINECMIHVYISKYTRMFMYIYSTIIHTRRCMQIICIYVYMYVWIHLYQHVTCMYKYGSICIHLRHNSFRFHHVTKHMHQDWAVSRPDINDQSQGVSSN